MKTLTLDGYEVDNLLALLEIVLTIPELNTGSWAIAISRKLARHGFDATEHHPVAQPKWQLDQLRKWART